MRERRLALLRAAMLLPLSETEHHLLQNITHNYALGKERDWAIANSHRIGEVEALFQKCSEMLS